MGSLIQNTVWGKVKTLPFIAMFKTDNVGASTTSTQVLLPLVSTGTYSFVVDWGDGTKDIISSWNASATKHTYAAIGTYEISMNGILNGLSFNNSGDKLKILSIKQWGCLTNKNNVSSSHFQGCVNLDMSTVSDIFNTTGCTLLTNMFLGNSTLTTINRIGEWNLSSINNITGMFQGCTNFNQNLGGWNTGTIRFASNLFANCSKFTNGGDNSIGNWNTANVEQFSNMFQGCSLFDGNVGAWTVSKSTNFSSMFYGCLKFNNGGSDSINNWLFNGVGSINTQSMFAGCSLFNQPIGNWNTNRFTNMQQIFENCVAFNQNISNWDVSNCTNIGYAFSGCTVFNQNISNWNVANNTNLTQTFYNTKAFNQDLGIWNVTKVTTFSSMFYSSVFNNGGSDNIKNWQINQLASVNMLQMFASTTLFNQPIGSWNTSRVTSIAGMFSNSTAFNQPIDTWDTSAVTSMNNTFATSKFNQPIGSWNTSNVLDMTATFSDNSVFNQPIGTWDTSKVTNMNYMLQSCSVFNQDLSLWNTSSVTGMNSTFSGALAFDQNIGSWNVSNVTNFSNFMFGKTPSTFSTTNLDAIYNGWSSRSVKTPITVSFGSAKRTAASTAGRGILTEAPNNWAITDGGI